MKFTPENRAKAISLARTVNFKNTIARMMRMHPNTLDSWLLRGAIDVDGNPLDSHPDVDEYVQFRLQFEDARATLESELANEARDKDPKFVLERAYHHWNPKAILTGSNNGETMNADTRTAAVNELRGMNGDLVTLIETAWCDPELGHAPAGVRQLFVAIGARWGWG